MGGKLPGKIVYFDGTDYVRIDDIGGCPELTTDEESDKQEEFTGEFIAEVPPNFVRKLKWMMAKNHLKAAFDLIFRREE